MRPLVILIGLAAIALAMSILAVFGRLIGFSWEHGFLAAGVTIFILIGTAFVATYVFLFFSFVNDEREYRKSKNE